jgi:1-acyl-sn-glycerol-3-phosphate acyltransferase
VKGLPSYPNRLLRRWRFASGAPGPGLWYRFFRRVFQVAFVSLWRVEVFNRHYEPAAGSVLYLCNHQSYLDPPLMGLALARPMNYMARDTLFRAPVFSRLIRSLNAFPVRRASADTGALKEALRRLRRGEQVVMFPEATRTPDGQVGPFLPGAALLARRGAEWIVPVVIEGAFECWPRTHRLPRPGRIVVAYDRPIPSRQVRDMPAEQFVGMVRERIVALQGDLRRRRPRA